MLPSDLRQYGILSFLLSKDLQIFPIAAKNQNNYEQLCLFACNNYVYTFCDVEETKVFIDYTFH